MNWDLLLFLFSLAALVVGVCSYVARRMDSSDAFTFEELRYEATRWQRRTFPNESIGSILAHLREELKELEDAPGDAHEQADVLLLLIALADRTGVDLVEAAKDKLEICKRRKWAMHPAGYAKSVKESEVAK